MSEDNFLQADFYNKRNYIDNIPELKMLFSGIPKYLLDRCYLKTVPDETWICKQGCPIDKITVLCSGTMRVVNEFKTGSSMIITHVGFMDIIGPLEILAEKENAACSVITNIQCTIIQLSKPNFIEWFNNDANLARFLAKMQSRLLFPNSTEIGEKLFYSSLFNVVHFLLIQFQNNRNPSDLVYIEKKRYQIAEELAITERSVNRSLALLKKDGLINIRKGHITMNYPQYLKLMELSVDLV